MQAVLMAGGEGRRLSPITAVLPKPLVPIGDISVLEMVLRQLRWYGFDHVILCVGHRAEIVIAVVGDGERFGLRIDYFVEERPLGTVGALAHLKDLEDDFLVMNGDVCTDLNFAEVLRWHRCQGLDATVSGFPRREKLELGVLELDENRQRLVGFREKPSFEFWVAMGVNAFSSRVLELIPREAAFGFDDLVAALLRQRWDTGVFTYDGFWLDIGRPDDHERMLDEFPRRRADLLRDEGVEAVETNDPAAP